MAISKENAKSTALNYTKAWCSHDPNAVASFYSENGRIIINGGEPSSARAEIAEMAQLFITISQTSL